MRKFLTLLSLTASLTFGAYIKSVTFNGLVHLSPQIAREITGLDVGHNFDYTLGDTAIKELYKQGYFEDIWIEEDDGHIIVNVQEKPTIAHIDIKGISEDDKKALLPLLGVNKGMTYDGKNIERGKKRIRQFYEAKGYFDTVVEESHEPLSDEASLDVTFKVNRGENIIIRSVQLVGANNLDYDDVEPAVINKERETFGWMWGFNDGKLRLEALPSDTGKIRDEYFAKGYLDAIVSTPYLKLYENTYDANIIYQVDEGEKYAVNSITFQIPENLLDEKELKDDLILQEGDTINVKKLRRDIKNIETKIADLGYAYVRVYPETLQNKEKHLVSIVYGVEPKEKVYIRKVIIGGNSRTADKVIRRELYLTAGDLYSKTNLEDSKSALKRTGYFEDVKITQKRINKNEMDLYVDIKEAPTGSIRGGIGYGSADGLLFDLGVSDKNIFGSGLEGSVNVSRSDKELSGRISLTNPRVFDSVYSLGGSLYAEDNDWSSYDERVYGASIVLGRKIGRHFKVSLGYVLEQTELSKLDQSLLDLGYKEGKSIKSAITPAITYDNTDDYYLPRRGIVASTSLEYAGIGGDEKFIKSISVFKAYYGLMDDIDYDLILRYKARLRYVWDKGNLPINERLYLGGISSVRGYRSRTIGPKNAKGYSYGGKQSFNNSVEVSFPLISRIKMRGAFFVDYGMIGIDSFDEYERYSAGAAIEWISPLGPINLIFAQPIDKKKGDETSSFEFTIGRRF